MNSYLITFLLLSLSVCGLTSGFLYSDLLKEIREWWIEEFFNSRLRAYGECQLCLSVITSLCLQWAFLDFRSITLYIAIALSSAVISWAIGTWVTMCGYNRAYYKTLLTIARKDYNINAE